FGLPPLEAMACGTPVVCSNTSSFPEVVGDAALTVDPLDPEALAEAMSQALRDATLRSRLSALGLPQAALFSWGRTARITLDMYRRAAPSVRRRRKSLDLSCWKL
ncbi:MAG: glycosyltransferase, partial [Chloroflexota bacterium]|nr:glycosyltransferase [Chloroflexota bacterium]